MPSVAFYTLGCKLNFGETSTLARQFDARGFARRDFAEAADLYLINTCSVTDNADKKCRKVVQQALRRNPAAKIVVVGCYAQLKPQEIASIPGVTVVLGAAEKFALFEHIDPLLHEGPAAVHHSPIAAANTFIPSYALEERTRAFLKLQDGCDYKCSFCTIPLARGSSRSATLDEILVQARHLTAQGAQEIVLSGINLGDYGANMDFTYGLLDVFRALDADAAVAPRLRISSIEPNLLSDELIDFVAGSQRFVPHFHVPLQSGSDTVLRLMRRRYQRSLYADRVAHIRRVMPDAAIGVDVIVGFPGETAEMFAETQAFLETLDVTYLHVFPYSERENTLAVTMPGRVYPHVRAERSELLRTWSSIRRRDVDARFVGAVRPVLWEEAAQRTTDGSVWMEGWTDNYVRVRTPYDPLLVGEITTTLLGQPHPDGGLLGEPLVQPALVAG